MTNITGRSWPTVEIGEVCHVQLGKMLSPKSKTGKRPVPYLRNENVQWNRFDLRNVAWMDFTEEEEAKFALLPGDLLVCEGGEPGRAAIWQGQIERCCFQKALHRIRPLRGMISPSYLMYFLWHAVSLESFSSSHSTTTISHLPREKLLQLRVSLAPLEEQTRIVAELTASMASVEKARLAAQQQLHMVQALPAALLREVFASAEA